MVVHFVSVLFTGFVIYTAYPGSSLFSWHPTLMVVAFSLLMVQSIIIFSPFSSLVRSFSRKDKTLWHWLLMLSVLLCSFLGYLAIYVNKDRSEKPHLTSWHSWVGLATLLYTALQCLGGALLWWARSYLLRFYPLSTWKLNHVTSGLLLFIMATVSLVTGMFTNWFVSMVEGTSWYACVCCPLVLLLVVTNQLRTSYFYVFNASGGGGGAGGGEDGGGDGGGRRVGVEGKKLSHKASKKTSKKSTS